MRRQIIEKAAYDVATQIRAVEQSIDGALAEVAELQGRILHVRSVATVGVATGHEAFEQLAASIQALVTARGAMAGCHAALADARGQVPGLRTVAFGDVEPDCPNFAATPLRAVA